MKKIRTLQILVYITFALFLLQNYAPGLFTGFRDGFADSFNREDTRLNDHAPSGPALDAVLQPNIIPGTNGDTLRVGKEYLLRNVKVTADVRVIDSEAKTPAWLSTCRILLAIAIIRLLLFTASYVNKVVLAIYKREMFEDRNVKLVREIGTRFIIYAIVDYLYKYLTYIKQTILIHPPLKPVNTVSFDFGLLLGAALIYIIAEAFKQGSKLKEEQELTI